MESTISALVIVISGQGIHYEVTLATDFLVVDMVSNRNVEGAVDIAVYCKIESEYLTFRRAAGSSHFVKSAFDFSQLEREFTLRGRTIFEEYEQAGEPYMEFATRKVIQHQKIDTPFGMGISKSEFVYGHVPLLDDYMVDTILRKSFPLYRKFKGQYHYLLKQTHDTDERPTVFFPT